MFDHEAAPPTGRHHAFVMDSVDLPNSANDASRLGLDLDGDPYCRVDNSLGGTVAWFNEQYGLDAEVMELIRAGLILQLINVQTPSLDGAPNIHADMLHGYDVDHDPTDNFSGAELFGVDPARGGGSADGWISGGVLSLHRGTTSLAIALPGLDEPFVVPIIGMRVEAVIAPDGIAGRIGGAIPQLDVDQFLLPVWAEALNRVVQRDCYSGANGASCRGGSSGEALLSWLDQNGDNSIGVQELRDDPLMSSLMAPDVDLLDSLGAFSPRTDGERDSLSLGFGFTAVPARIEPYPRQRPGTANLAP